MTNPPCPTCGGDRVRVGKRQQLRCRPCWAAYMRERHHNLDDVARERVFQNMRRFHLKKAYGLSPEEFQTMLAAQDNRCAVCGSDDPRSSGRSDWSFAVDHDHRTGKVRALLCHPCNRALGQADDSPERLRALASYLEAHS